MEFFIITVERQVSYRYRADSGDELSKDNYVEEAQTIWVATSVGGKLVIALILFSFVYII